MSWALGLTLAQVQTLAETAWREVDAASVARPGVTEWTLRRLAIDDYLRGRRPVCSRVEEKAIARACEAYAQGAA